MCLNPYLLKAEVLEKMACRKCTLCNDYNDADIGSNIMWSWFLSIYTWTICVKCFNVVYSYAKYARKTMGFVHFCFEFHN